MKKHLQVLPSVVVVFADIDWTNPDTRVVVSTVAKVRQLLAGRLTKVVVVLLQTDSSTPTDTVMTALCAQCGLSSRAIFPLRVGEGEEIAGRVVQLEIAVQELAQNYYHGQIKVVRSHREQMNKTSHLQLLVRHGFKLGFLNELKSDHHAAYKSYTAAYQLLSEMRYNPGKVIKVNPASHCHILVQVDRAQRLRGLHCCRLPFLQDLQTSIPSQSSKVGKRDPESV